MELLVTLRDYDAMEKLLHVYDGVIAGRLFTNGYHFSLDQLRKIGEFCRLLDKKFYIALDDFIDEDHKVQLYEYLDIIARMDADGIFFHDLGVYEAARSFNMGGKLIYDGKSVLCNSLDCAFMLNKGIDSVMISRELTFEEIMEIVKNNPQKISLQIFGHTRLSYSKRRFLTNYFQETGIKYDYKDKETLSLVEEQRDYRMPVIETDAGTYIYSDYIFEMFYEFCELAPYLYRGIVDTLFIDDTDMIVQAAREFRRLNADNRNFIREGFIRNHPYSFSTAFLYRKTNKTKI